MVTDLDAALLLSCYKSLVLVFILKPDTISFTCQYICCNYVYFFGGSLVPFISSFHCSTNCDLPVVGEKRERMQQVAF